MSMSKPERTALFCSSILALSKSLNFRLTVLSAAPWSSAFAWILTIWLLSILRSAFSSVSYSLVAWICKKETAPTDGPTRKYRPSLNKKELGAM